MEHEDIGPGEVSPGVGKVRVLPGGSADGGGGAGVVQAKKKKKKRVDCGVEEEDAGRGD